MSGFVKQEIWFYEFSGHCETNDSMKGSKKFSAYSFQGTLMQIWKSVNILVFIRTKLVEDFTLKHLLLFEICAREICDTQKQ